MKTREGKNGNEPVELDIQTIMHEQAVLLLTRTRKAGIYKRFVPRVIEALQKLKSDDHISFHAPDIDSEGKKEMIPLKLMSAINYGLREEGIPHRIRVVKNEGVLISEPWDWNKK